MRRIPMGMKVAYVLVAAFLVLLLVPSVQAADRLDRLDRLPMDDKRTFWDELKLQTVMGAADLASTEWALTGPNGGREINPLGGTRQSRIVIKSVATAGIATITWELERTGRRRSAKVVRWGWAGLQLLAVLWNGWQGWEARR